MKLRSDLEYGLISHEVRLTLGGGVEETLPVALHFGQLDYCYVTVVYFWKKEVTKINQF